MTLDKNTSYVPISWFTKTLARFIPLYVEVILLAIIIRILALVEPFIFQVLIDRVLPFQREQSLVAIAVILALAAVAHIGFDILLRIVNTACANRVSLELGNRVFASYTNLPLAAARKWKVGETIARIDETETIHAFLGGTSIRAALDLLFVAGYVFVLFALSPILATIVIAALPVNALIYLGLGPVLRRKLQEKFEAGAAYQSATVEAVAGFTTVRALGKEKKIVTNLSSRLGGVLKRGFELEIVRLINDNAIFLVERVVTVSILFVGANLVFANELTLGQLVAFHLLSASVVQPVANFARLWEDWQNLRISRLRLGEILSEEKDLSNAKIETLPSHVPFVELHNVSFSYEGNTVQILNHEKAKWKTHSLNLIVGTSGIGKSTLGRLIGGLEVPTTGTITFDGHDINQFAIPDLRKLVAYVQQDSFLFEGTVRDNLALDDNIPDERIFAAFEALGFGQLNQQLSGGLDAKVGERGAKLSGGQRQKLAIARAFLRDPKILILDEPTSAMDPESRTRFAAALSKLKETMTIIVITHNVDAFTNVDSVMSIGEAA